MKTIILTTNTAIYQIKNTDGKLFITNENGDEIPNPGSFILSMGGIDAIPNRCKEIEIPFEEFLKEIEEKNKIIREERKLEHEKKTIEAESVIRNSESTAREIYDAFCYLNKKQFGWGLCDQVFLGENNLSKLLLSKLHSYTVTPYDDGAVIIKSNGKSYSNHRRFAKAGSIIDLIEL